MRFEITTQVRVMLLAIALAAVSAEALVRYSAVIWDGSVTYGQSVEEGARNLVNEINDIAAKCPMTNIALVGYSQGADVIESAIGIRRSASLPAISSAARGRINAVLIGDPSYRHGEVWDAAGNGTGDGINPAPAGQFRNITRSDWTGTAKNAVYSLCFPGDLFCQANPGGKEVHESYKSSGKLKPAYDWLEKFYVDND